MDSKKIKKKYSSLGVIVGVAIVTFILYTSVLSNIQIKQTPTWHVIWEGSLAEASEANPGAGAGGFLEIFFLNYSATPSTTYARNDSSSFETWADANLLATGSGGHAYASATSFNLQLKHDVRIDIVIRCRFNVTQAYTDSEWIDANCRCNITCAGGGITISNVAGTRGISENVSGHNYIYINFYWQNANYKLLTGGTCTINPITISAKY